MSRLIDETDRHALCVVLADFSPKNILIVGPRIALVDFETGHYGDPAFDLGFFLSHLLLKTVLHGDRFSEYADLTIRFRNSYREGIRQLGREGPMSVSSMGRRTIPHLAACLWARIDATSKIDYLPNEEQKQLVRDFSRSLFVDPPGDWESLLERLHDRLTLR